MIVSQGRRGKYGETMPLLPRVTTGNLSYDRQCVLTEPSTDCRADQINTILSNPFQHPIHDNDTGVQYYHIKGCYPSNGKPIWSIEGGKIKIVGMYKHPQNDNKVYKKKSHEGDGRKFIRI